MAGFFGLFNYAKEGPGVSKDAPQKRPFFAFMDIYGRKFWNLAVAGLLYSLVSIPVSPTAGQRRVSPASLAVTAVRSTPSSKRISLSPLRRIAVTA